MSRLSRLFRRSRARSGPRPRAVMLRFDDLEVRALLSGAPTNPAFVDVHLYDMRNDPTYAGIDGSGIGVAVLDTGVDAQNPDLSGNFAGWYDAVTPSNTTPNDPEGHGTHVSGTVASTDPNIGVADHATLYDVRALPGPGEASPGYDTVQAALNWVLQWNGNHPTSKIYVVNMSLGGHQDLTTPRSTDDAEAQAIAALEQSGVTVVTSAGNYYADFEQQGVAFPGIISTLVVGSTWQDSGSNVGLSAQNPLILGGPPQGQYATYETAAQADQISAFSQRADLSNMIFAPGEVIYSTWNGTGDKAHNLLQGTSQAAPLVTGAVALMQQAAIQFGGHPLTPAQVVSIVESTADPIVDNTVQTDHRVSLVTDQNGQVTGLQDGGVIPGTGQTFGRIDIYKAIQAVRQLVSTPSTGGGGTGAADTNNTMASATVEPTLDGTQVFTDSGAVGADGQVQIGANDVDLYKVTTTEPGSLAVQVSSAGDGHDFSALIRLFDASGHEIAPAATTADAQGYPTVGGPVEPAGTYYFGISSAGNASYNVADGTGASGGQTQGDYQLTFGLLNPDPNGVLQGAEPVNDLASISSADPIGTVYSGEIGTDPPPLGSTQRVQVGPGDVDMFSYVAPDDGYLIAQTYADANSAYGGLKAFGGQAADTYLRVFDANGGQLAANDNSGTTTDSYLSVFVHKGQTYYVGVSDAANGSYDPSNPYTRNAGGYGGLYELGLSFDNGDRNGTIQNATSFQVGTTVNGVIGTDLGGPLIGKDGSLDVDFEAYTPTASGYLDIQASSPDSSMTPSIALWSINSAGTDVVEVVEASGPNARIEYPVQSGTTYYVSVTGLGNQDFKWYAVASGSGGQTGQYTLTTAIETPAQVAPQSDNSVDDNNPVPISAGNPVQGSIGVDGALYIGTADVDLYRFVATQDQLVDVRTDTSIEGSVDTNLRVFDAQGHEIAHNDDLGAGQTASEVVFHAAAGQTYYIGVNASGPSDDAYDPLTGQGAAAGNSQGGYVLKLNALVPGVAVDNRDAGYAQAGPWTNTRTIGGYTAGFGGDYNYAAPTGGAASTAAAAWQAVNLAPGSYDVEVSWVAGTNRATNAPYKVYDGSTLLGTATVNQQLAPAGLAAGGVAFQSLGVYTVTTGTLVVVLGNNANGYVVADAVLVAPPRVVPAVADNGGTGFAELGPWTAAKGYGGYGNAYDYAAPGTGASTATWTTPGLAPGAYDVQVTWAAGTNRATNATYKIYDGATLLATVGVNQQLAPAGPTVGGVTFQTLGSYQVNSGTLRVVLSNAANGYVVADALRVAPPAAPLFVDSGGAGFGESGPWTTAKGYGGYGNAYDYAAPGSGTSTATWTAAGLTPGSYNVQVTWGAGTNRATNAPYRIYDGNTLLATVTINQQLAPSGLVYGGVVFQSLGVFRVGSGTLRVALSNAANGYVVADAMRVAPPAALPAVVDSGGAGFGESGPWTTAKGYGGYGNAYDYAAPGTGASTATWTTPGLAPGAYDVQVTWAAGTNRATNATYKIYDGATLLATVGVNQQLAPAGPTIGGVTFQTLGSYQVNSGTLRVVLSNAANGYVVADAMRVAPALPVAVVDSGGPGFGESGPWTTAKGYGGYGNAYDYAAPGSGNSTATWTAGGLAPGAYGVQVSWGAGTNRATNATYQVYDGTTLLATLTINQQLAPSGLVYGGVAFQSLGVFKVGSGTLRVVLSNKANGYVVADALLVTG